MTMRELSEIRQITHFDRAQVKRLMAELNRGNTAIVSGRGWADCLSRCA